jgi:YVTN family beta-propeller protein
MSRHSRLRPLAGLLALGIIAPASAAPSQPFPTYFTGLQPNGSYVVSNGQIITPAGLQVNLGTQVRAKAVALNPIASTHTAAVLTMGASQAVANTDADAAVLVFDTLTGEVVQRYLPFKDSNGSYGGIAYSADGKFLMLSQASSYVSIATVGPDGLLTDYAHVSVPPNSSQIKCFPNSPIGDYGEPCGTLYSTYTSYPGGLAFSKDGKSAYALLNQNNTFATIDLTQNPPVLGTQLRVGNAPHSIVLHGNYAYVSNEGGRIATKNDFQVLSAGTPIVADTINGSAVTGTVSVVDTLSQKVVANIPVGLHPTGMAIFGAYLLVSNTYSDTISVIDMDTNHVMRTIKLGLPVSIPGSGQPSYGAAPTGIAVDQSAGIAYVALYNANAIAVVDLGGAATRPVMGMIPVAYAPASVVLDKTAHELIVANDKGIGTLASFETDHGVTGYNSHQDTGTVTIVKLPNALELQTMTKQVHQNNHWDLTVNIDSASGGSTTTAPVAIPAHIGDPSLIKHVFLIIRENRTYDQMLGDVAAGNGDPDLAVFGGKDTPNMHNLVTRFPLLDNFYDPSRQSADGHQWITEAMAPYQDDIQAPDWVRSYPGGNAGDSLAYTQKGFLFQETVAAGLPTKLYGEYMENENFPTALGHPTWSQFYADSLAFETNKESTLKYQNVISAESSVPAVSNHLIKNFPDFDLNIPDQFRVDIWLQDFRSDLSNGTVPSLSILWIMCDHTGGPPTVDAEEADNDLAVGRIIDTISHSGVWKDSAIFIEEDDAQNGVDHIDGHRSPGYVVSPYAVQGGPTDHTYYTQVNMTRTIEQILGLPPLNQFDLVASPMLTDFTNTPNFTPWNHVRAEVPLTKGVMASNAPLNDLEKAWQKKKKEMFAGKMTKPDSEDPYTLNHLIWYEATRFTRPYPGEKTVRPPSEFANRIAPLGDDD